MDVNLSYAEWLSQVAMHNSCHKITFADDTAVVFCRLQHETRLDTADNVISPDVKESDID